MPSEKWTPTPKAALRQQIRSAKRSLMTNSAAVRFNLAAAFAKLQTK